MLFLNNLNLNAWHRTITQFNLHINVEDRIQFQAIQVFGCRQCFGFLGWPAHFRVTWQQNGVCRRKSGILFSLEINHSWIKSSIKNGRRYFDGGWIILFQSGKYLYLYFISNKPTNISTLYEFYLPVYTQNLIDKF